MNLLNIELIVLVVVSGRTHCISEYNLDGESNSSIEVSCVDHSRKANKWVILISDQAHNVNLLVEDLAAANEVPYRRLLVTIKEFGLAVTCEKTECEFVPLQKNAE
jgi:hypothetical protein